MLAVSGPRVCAVTPLLMLLCVGTTMHAEDVKVREQAVQLLEIANAVSLPGALHSYKQAVTFRYYEPDGTAKAGTYTRYSAGAAGYREEITFGAFHSATVISGDKISDTRTDNELPEIRALRNEIPVHLARFDEKDTIRSIEETSVAGRAARCIHFDTQFGATHQVNQLCFDSSNGAIVLWIVGDERIESTDYFKVGALWEPGHIRRYENGVLRMEIEQQLEAIEGTVDPKVFAPPSSKWNQLFPCKNPRRAIALSTPMPPPGKAGTDIVDVVVHAWIWEDGSVKLPQIESSNRPDLNEEAMQTVLSWKFLPLMCNDRVATTTGDLVVHFQGR